MSGQERAPREQDAVPTAPDVADLLKASVKMGAESDAVSEALNTALLAPLQEFLARPRKGVRAALVTLGYELAGGGARPLPEELPALLELLHAGSLIIDDIQDEAMERRGAPALHRQIGTPLALNAGNYLYFLPLMLMERTALPPDAKLNILQRVHRCLVECHEGQALDLHVRLSTVDGSQLPSLSRAIASRKTGALMELATSAGALCAGADEWRAHAIGRLGRALGEGLQMLDDLSGVINPRFVHKGIEDLREDAPTWSWACLADGAPAMFEVLRQEHVGCTNDAARRVLLERLRLPVAAHGPAHADLRFADGIARLERDLGDDSFRANLEAWVVQLRTKFLGGGA